MFQQAIQTLASNDFKKVINVAHEVNNETVLKQLPNVTLKTFLTKDSFYRPHDSEFINSFVDTFGRTHRIYALDFSKTILVLSQPTLGEFQHTLCMTTNDKGFYLDEVLELTSVLGTLFSSANI